MAPLASDPRQILVVCNLARRKALLGLVSSITEYMRTQLLEIHGPGSGDGISRPPHASSRPGQATGATAADQAPLFAPPKDDGTPSPEAGGPRAGGRADSAKIDVGVSQRKEPPSPELVRVRRAAVAHLDAWRKEVLGKLKEICLADDDAKVLDARKQRLDEAAKLRAETPGRGEDLISFGDESSPRQADADEALQAVKALQALYHPIPTRLTTIPEEDRKDILSCLLVLLLSTGNYSAYSRTLILYLASAFELPLLFLTAEETEIAKTLVEAANASDEDKKKVGMSADAEAQKRKQANQAGRYWKVGLASVAGAAIVGITGGLAAPVVAGAIGGLMGSVGLGGVASFLGIFWMNGALVGTLFGAFGAKMTGEMVDQYAKEVEDFKFLPLKEEWGADYRNEAAKEKDARRLRVTIGINGWLTSKEDVTKPWRALGDETEVFALRYEVASLLALGENLEALFSSYAWSFARNEILKRTVLATVYGALWPIGLLKLASNVDNPFNLARNRSEKAGQILADALINRVQGERPVTLVGYSLGARAVYACLRSLAERRAFGLVDSVVLIGAPVPSSRAHWLLMRSVVAGKLFNVYSSNDYILAFMYRAASIQLGIAGLQAIRDIDGVENLDLTDEVKGHLRYPDLLPQILTRCGFPGVRGGDKPIEKEEDVIVLDDPEARGRTGDLIQLDDLPSEETPLPKPPHPARAPPTAAPEGPQAGAASEGLPVPPIVRQAKADSNRFRDVVSKAQPNQVATGHDPLGSAPEKPLEQEPLKEQQIPSPSPVAATPSSRSQPASEMASKRNVEPASKVVEPKRTDRSSHPTWRESTERKVVSYKQEESDGDDCDVMQMESNDDSDEDFNDMVYHTEPLRIDD